MSSNLLKAIPSQGMDQFEGRLDQSVPYRWGSLHIGRGKFLTDRGFVIIEQVEERLVRTAARTSPILGQGFPSLPLLGLRRR